MAEYTQRLNDALYSSWTWDNEADNHDKLLEYLNGPDFRTFGAGLSALVETKITDTDKVTAIEYIKKCCKEKNITLASRNTLTNWFTKEIRPKKSSDSREMMFAIAFALELSVEETKYLFQNIYLDRAINEREYKELIYYHCLKTRKTFQHAKELINRVSLVDTEEDSTIYTALIASETNSMDDEEILEYIKNHPHNFRIRNTAAKEAVAKYLSRATIYAQEEASRLADDGMLRGKNRSSLNFVYEMITGGSVTGESGTKTIFKNAELPREIKSNFPQPAVFAKEEPTFEELRKMIVLLFSYCFWYEVQRETILDYFDDYVMLLDQLLTSCGLSKLYYGNSFDWMFLYCAYTVSPLDTFRGVLAEALGWAE